MRILALALLAWTMLLPGCVPTQATQPARSDPPARNPFDKPATTALIGPLNPDRRCRVDADCTVKNVGNCCGHYPMCVNRDAKVDPAVVRAQCRKTGMASVCGFPEIAGCRCVQRQCRDTPRAL